MVLKGVMDKKTQNLEIRIFAILSQPRNLTFCEDETRFFNFFLSYMVQKYQNEISPIFYYGKGPKTNEKDLKIPNLRPPD